MGERPESAFERLKATSSPGSCMMYSHGGYPPISRFAANRDPDSRFPAEIGKRGISRFPISAESGIGDSLPDSRPNRESGERELGISGSGGALAPWNIHKVPPASAKDCQSWNPPGGPHQARRGPWATPGAPFLGGTQAGSGPRCQCGSWPVMTRSPDCPQGQPTPLSN